MRFCTKFGKSSLEIPEMLLEDFREHSLSWTADMNNTHASRLDECLLKITNGQCGQAPAKWQNIYIYLTAIGF
jgi:hypothetical protein